MTDEDRPAVAAPGWLYGVYSDMWPAHPTAARDCPQAPPPDCGGCSQPVSQEAAGYLHTPAGSGTKPT